MRKKITHILTFRDEGDEKTIEIDIDFVSNRVLKDYSELIVMAEKAEQAHNRISDISTIVAGEELTAEKKESLQVESADCVKTIMKFNDNGYFQKRFEILKRLLVDNGHKENEKLMNFDFWENCVEPAEQLKFMMLAIYKDVDEKKKVFKQ